MILESDVYKIGKLLKPHGIKGEISFAYTSDIFDHVDCPYLICKVDGILVPFFISEYRMRGDNTALVLFEDMDSGEKVSKLSGLEVFYPNEYRFEEDDEDADYTWDFFIGYTLHDEKHGDIGLVENVDDSTINTLFLVKKDDNELIIPANEDFITSIDTENKIIHLKLMDGLIDLD